jgi:hypothetical protein
MIDAPDRPVPRFPPSLEPAAARAIGAELDRLTAGPRDVSISGAACGGDLLFAEAALSRGLAVRIYLPVDEPSFLEQSVSFAGDAWLGRYRSVIGRARVSVAPEVLGPLPPGGDPFERANLWMLQEAKRLGGAHLVFLCLWNGEGGDGPGGTRHMMDAVRSAGGNVVWIDIRRL